MRLREWILSKAQSMWCNCFGLIAVFLCRICVRPEFRCGKNNKNNFQSFWFWGIFCFCIWTDIEGEKKDAHLQNYECINYRRMRILMLMHHKMIAFTFTIDGRRRSLGCRDKISQSHLHQQIASFHRNPNFMPDVQFKSHQRYQLLLSALKIFL